jgi:predicted ATP-grasp superfamily ATP-dependent carboligase
VKHRSWPPGFGVTTSATSVANPALAAASVDLCRRIGYRGIVDMDWRLDRRDGAYRLLDCNPRIGAQFRLFENEVGIDVARALHLDLTGRDVPRAPQVDGRSFVVENLDLAARLLAGRHTTSRAVRTRPRSTERAWFTWDDPAPFALMAIRQLGPIARRVARRLGR